MRRSVRDPTQGQAHWQSQRPLTHWSRGVQAVGHAPHVLGPQPPSAHVHPHCHTPSRQRSDVEHPLGHAPHVFAPQGFVFAPQAESAPMSITTPKSRRMCAVYARVS